MEKCLKLLLCIAVTTVVTVTASKMQMPSYASTGEKVVLECQLDHDPKDIEHVKWYKDNELFYYVIPSNEPSTSKMDLHGVPINMSESRMDKIILDSVVEESSGLYTCELKMEDRMARMSGTLMVYPAKE